MSINFNTQLNHNGNTLKGLDKGIPKVAPIVMSGAYYFTNEADLRASLSHEIPDYDYGREGNATNDCANSILEAVEGGAKAQVYATGMGAITTAIHANIAAGDHIILSSIVFGGTYNFVVNKLQKKFGVEVTVVDMSREDWVDAFRPNTKIVYMETISNPMMEVLDLRKIAEVTHRHGAKLMVDNTFATPVVCRVLDLGADFSLYSATKYLNGHSDILAGAVVGRDAEDMRLVIKEGHCYGPTMSPFDAFLLTRSLRTLELRMRQHSSNAMKLAAYFEKHPKVKKVYYPGLSNDAYHKIAESQFNDGMYGGMMSIDLGSHENVMASAPRFRYVKMVASLGCLTTTFSDPRTSHGAMTAEERAACGIVDSVMRISVGLENIDDVLEDFDQALAGI